MVGFVVMAAGIVNIYYSNKLKNAELETFQATVTKIRPTVSSAPSFPYSSYCPEVEYFLEDTLIKAHYVSLMLRDQINFKVGDTINILVDINKPKEFFLGNEFRRSKNAKALVIMGALAFASGIIIVIGGSL